MNFGPVIDLFRRARNPMRASLSTREGRYQMLVNCGYSPTIAGDPAQCSRAFTMMIPRPRSLPDVPASLILPSHRCALWRNGEQGGPEMSSRRPERGASRMRVRQSSFDLRKSGVARFDLRDR
jgi:hypothetical protein